MDKIEPLPEHGPTIAAMLDTFTDGKPLIILDRSDIEEYANCPFAAHCKRTGIVKPNSIELQAGNVVHDALSFATADYIDNWEEIDQSIIETNVMQHVYTARPDLQIEAVEGIRRSVRSWAYFLNGISHDAIIGYDGGRGDRSSQLAKDYTEFGVRATSELDLIYASDSPEVVNVIDYKSGYKMFTHEDVATSFQFGQHVFFIFDHFPETKAIDYQVWNTRFNIRTFKATFLRSRYEQYESRLRTGIKAFFDNQTKPACWPEKDKCEKCESILLCPAVDQQIKSLEADPVGFIQEMRLIEIKYDEMKAKADKFIDKNGDVILDGYFYGRNNPKERKRTATFYK